jgi:hypothetical protein
MIIGTMFLGKVDSLHGESVQTKFFVFGVPLVPVSSFYFLEGRKGFEIPINNKSVNFGYARAAAWGGTMLCGLFAYLGHGVEASNRFRLGLLLLLASLAITFLLGKLSKGEQLRRMILKKTAGIAAPPSLLPEKIRASTLTGLKADWKKERGDESWQAAIKSGEKHALLFAIAAYSLRPELADRALASLVAPDVPKPNAGPYRT